MTFTINPPAAPTFAGTADRIRSNGATAAGLLQAARPQQWIKNGAVLMGVSTQATTTGSGVEVMTITPGSSAANARLQTGDIITAIDDQPIATPDDLAAAIAAHQPGDLVTVTIERNTAQQRLSLTLGTRT